MSPAPLRNLWPNDISFDEVIPPEEILAHQAQLLAQKTNGRLVGHVERLTSEGRVVLGFEVEAPLAGNRIRLFEVQHRLEFEYPARVFPPKPLPEYLKDRVYQPGIFEDGPTSILSGTWVKRDWLASTPSEFSDLIATVLDSASTKALILSLLSRAKEGQGNGTPSAG